MSNRLLSLDNVSIQFGGLKAVADLSLHVDAGELIGLIGPNGAGKTTVFNLITGVYAPTAGRIEFAGHHVHKQRPYKITSHGIARTFQNIRLFDNVRCAFNLSLKQGITDTLVRGGRFEAEEDEIEVRALELLEIFHLAG